MIHEIKIHEKYADRIITGEKTFEVRINDRDYQVGDLIRFRQVLTDHGSIPHAITHNVYAITYMLQSIAGIEPGYCVFGIALECSEGEKNDEHE